jgi:ribose 5-phosphate isomerase B
MRIAVAADHRGFEAKRKLLPLLKQMGHEPEDFGCDGTSNATDYPDFAIPAAKAVADGRCEAGIFLDGSGIGMSVAANKVRGIRAALAHDEVTARLSREHNHCNVLCLGSDLLNENEIRKIINVFLTTPFGEGRHARRVEKLKQFEQDHFTPPDQSQAQWQGNPPPQA